MRNYFYSILILSSMLFTATVDHYMSFLDNNEIAVELSHSYDGEDRDIEDQLEEYKVLQAASLIVKSDLQGEHLVHTYQFYTPYTSFDLSDQDTPPPRV